MNHLQKNNFVFEGSMILIVLLLVPTIGALYTFDLKQTLLPFKIFGYRTEAMFDLWSIQHLISGVLIGSMLKNLRVASGLNILKIISIVTAIAFCWEMIEYLMEAGTFGNVVANWKDGHEHWPNRLIGDPLLVIIGSLIGYRFKNTWKIVFFPAFIWLLLNIASPNSMYIQHLIFG